MVISHCRKSMIPKTEVELLVHISAPSTGAQDAKFRKQASGFLNFRAGTRQKISPLSTNQDHNTLSHEVDRPERAEGRHEKFFRNEENKEGVAKELSSLETPSYISSTSSDAVYWANLHHPSPGISRQHRAAERLQTLLDRSIVKETPQVHVKQTPFHKRAISAPLLSVAASTSSNNVILETPTNPGEVAQPLQLNALGKRPAVHDLTSSSATDEYPISPSFKRRRYTDPSSTSSPSRPRSSPEFDHFNPDPNTAAGLTTTDAAPDPAITIASSTEEDTASLPASSNRPIPLSQREVEPDHQNITAVDPSPSPLPISSQLLPTILSHDIIPPQPQTTNNAFATHTTPSLLLITEKLPLSKRFQPIFPPNITNNTVMKIDNDKSEASKAAAISKDRHPTTHERGFWQFDIPAEWDVETRVKFWAFLEQFVGEGRAGWNVYVEGYESGEDNNDGANENGIDIINDDRDDGNDDNDIHDKGNEEYDDDDRMRKLQRATRAPSREGRRVPSALDDATDEKRKKAQKIGPEHEHEQDCLTTDPMPKREVVRVWCWGEIVGHIWLLLFLASGRKVKGCGARWFSAVDGQLVVQMA